MDNLLKIEENSVFIKNEPNEGSVSFINDGKITNSDKVCCGEIFVINSENYWIICRICNLKFTSTSAFIDHTIKLHIEKSSSCGEIEINANINRQLKSEIEDCNNFANEEHNNDDDVENPEHLYVNEKTIPQDGIIDDGDEDFKSYDEANENYESLDTKSYSDEANENSNGTDLKRTIRLKKNQCDICKKVFDRPCKLKRHMGVHEKQMKDKSWQCTFCGDIFTKKNLYRNHRETYHKERVKCEYCDKTFGNKNNLKEHINMHKNERPFQCDKCPMNYYSKASLTCHIRRVHLKDTPHTCPHCGKKFLRSCALTIHIRIHTGEKPYVCELCGANYQTSSLLANHIKRHNNDRRYSCEICGKKFFNNTYLRDHKISVHTQEKPFGCDVCEAKFSGKPALRKHKKLHSAVKEYICNICGKAYAQSPGLYAHMKSHQIASEKALIQ